MADVDLQEYFNREVQREKEAMRRKLIYAFAMLAIVYLASIAVFHYFEGWNWLDSVYFTTSTITTVGYGDMVPHSFWGRLYTIPLMWIGIAVGFYVIFTITAYGRSKVESRLGSMFDTIEDIGGISHNAPPSQHMSGVNIPPARPANAAKQAKANKKRA